MASAAHGAAGYGAEPGLSNGTRRTKPFAQNLKDILIFLVSLRLLSTGILGKLFSNTVAAAAAFGAGYGKRFLPRLLREAVGNLDTVKESKWAKLGVSVGVDAIGCASVFMPEMVEVFLGDAGWTPISVFIIQYLYNRPMLTAINFLEETLPFTDLFPTATVGWLMDYNYIKEKHLQAAANLFKGKPPKSRPDNTRASNSY